VSFRKTCLWGAMIVLLVAMAGCGGGVSGAAGSAGSNGGGSGSSTTSGNRIFTGPGANWLYSAPTGSGISIASQTSGLGFGIHAHTDHWDFPVQYTDGTHGTTTFNDSGAWYNDTYAVPNPANGYWPAIGGDGHLVVVNTADGSYYDFWELQVNGNGTPVSTHVGRIVRGFLNGDGTPGTTAANITGLAGDIMPGELDCETCLNHALSVVVPMTMTRAGHGSQAPGGGYDGSTPGGIFEEGAKLRFDPNVDVSSLPASTAAKAIMRALQLYGGVITDRTQAGGCSFYSSLPSDPDQTGMNLIGQHLMIYY
jgi:hypothetical protein